jgi:probable selenium-dependent hydroxylase accessory protein YqeC
MRFLRHQRLSDLLSINGSETIAVMGAGGKHTFLARLASELSAQSKPIIVTSTTNFHYGAVSDAEQLVTMQERDDWSARLDAILSNQRTAFVFGEKLAGGMLRGLTLDQLDELRRGLRNAVLAVKADGARKRSFKAPGEGEPVLPRFVDLAVTVVGLDVVGKPLTKQHVHRVEQVVRLSGLRPGDPIWPTDIARSLNHSGGYSGKIPPSVKSAVFLSKLQTGADRANAERIAGLIDRRHYGLIVAGDTLGGEFYEFHPA